MFSSLFTRDPAKDFPYEIKEKFNRNVELELFSICKGKKKNSEDEVSIFIAEAKALNPQEINLAKSCAKRLKTLKHPSILSYVDSLETDSYVQLVTEPVLTLKTYLESLRSLDQHKKELLISWGLYQIATVIKFLTQDAKLIHNNLHLNSIYVNNCGDWKLFGLEYLYNQASGSDTTKPYSLEKYSPPESKSGVSNLCVWSTDCWGLACLIWEIFNGPMTSSGQSGGVATLKSPKSIPKTLHSAYAKLLVPNPANRCSPEQFLEICRKTDGFMKNKLVDSLLFLEEFQLKEAREKSQFFSHINECLELMPSDMQKYKILPQLINAFEFGNAGSAVLAPLLKISKLLKDDEYQHQIVPCVVKLFGSTDRATRVKLLQQVDSFIEHLQPAIVNDKIFPHLASGFMDTNAAVRESSVKAVISFAPKLNYNNLNVEIMKHFARLQSKDDQPGIRTNTTICMGKIACYIHSQVRQRILISAFTRALKDPFPPARIAGILALSATQQYYMLNEVAFKILPALCTCTMDSEKQVRDQSFKAIRGFMDKLEKASENPELIPDMESQVNANSSGGIMSSESVPQWANWAFSALSSKFYKNPQTVASAKVGQGGENAKVDEKLGKSQSSTTSLESLKRSDKIDKDNTDKNESNVSSIDAWGDIDDDVVGDAEPSGGATGWDVDDDDAWEGIEEAPKINTTVTTSSFKKPQNVLSTSVHSKSPPRKDSLDELFSDKSAKQPNVSSKTASSGWEVDDEPQADSAWNDDSWAMSAANSNEDELDMLESQDKTSRKAQAALRNQQRKAELEQKRQAKQQQSGPLKLGAKKAH